KPPTEDTQRADHRAENRAEHVDFGYRHKVLGDADADPFQGDEKQSGPKPQLRLGARRRCRVTRVPGRLGGGRNVGSHVTHAVLRNPGDGRLGEKGVEGDGRSRSVEMLSVGPASQPGPQVLKSISTE